MAFRAFMLTNKRNFHFHVSEGSWTSLSADEACTGSRLAFVFTGQGAQWPQMGLDLFRKSSCFRSTIEVLDRELKKLPHAPSWTLESKFFFRKSLFCGYMYANDLSARDHFRATVNMLYS